VSRTYHATRGATRQELHGHQAGRDYYDPATWSGAVRCVDCLCDQGASFALLDSLRVAYDAGRPVSEGSARLGLPADTCNECDTCARPVCRGQVCGACGYAPGCAEHEEGHHPSCTQSPNTITAEAGELRPPCDCDQSGSGFSLCRYCYDEQVGGDS